MYNAAAVEASARSNSEAGVALRSWSLCNPLSTRRSMGAAPREGKGTQF